MKEKYLNNYQIAVLLKGPVLGLDSEECYLEKCIRLGHETALKINDALASYEYGLQQYEGDYLFSMPSTRALVKALDKITGKHKKFVLVVDGLEIPTVKRRWRQIDKCRCRRRW